MVKLTVAPPELYAKEATKKLPPDSGVEIPLEKEIDVDVARRPFCTKGTTCSLLTFLAILLVGGALLGLYMGHAHRAPRCYDWGPNCEMKGPPVPPVEHYHDGPGMKPGGDSSEMPGSNGGSHHGGDGGHHHDGDRHGGRSSSSSSSSSEEHGSGHDRHHGHPAEGHPDERPHPQPEAPIPDFS